MSSPTYQVPPASTLYVADYDVVTLTTAPAAGGLAVANTPPVDPGYDYAWLLDQIAVQCTSSSATTAKVFIGEPGTTRTLDLVAGTGAGNLDFDDVAGSGLLMRAGEAVTVQWSGASNGAVGTARIQYRVLRQSR